jgi:uncharacterized membrane protein HdeD (DUF308 family)
MTLLSKKVAGVGLALLGGLTLAHGASAGQAWETLLGLLTLAIGVALLVAKVVRRNAPADSAR